MIPMRPTNFRAGIQQVTPVAAETQRALSEFKEVERNNEPHMPLKNTIKRGGGIPKAQSIDHRQVERT